VSSARLQTPSRKESPIASLRQILRTLVRSERGQGLVEYTLIVLLMSILLIGVISTFGADIEDGLIDSIVDLFP